MKRGILLLLVFSLGLLSACTGETTEPSIYLNGTQIGRITMFVGQELALECNVDADSTWASSNLDIVTVEQDGYLRARSEGVATVKVRSGKKTASVEITVVPYVGVESVVSGAQSIEIKAGGRKTLRMTVLPENASDPSLQWTVEPADGKLWVEDGVLYAAEDAGAGTVYSLTATNSRSAVSCTVEAVISQLKGLTAWTIGDSIFDFRDNSQTDTVQTMLQQTGYTNLYMDNIAGATIRAASGVGIIEHIESGMYDVWPEPDLIIVFRGTNDVYFSIQQPNFFTEDSIVEAVEKTCQYLHEHYPDARIIWATPLWRNDIEVERMDWMRQLLHSTCPQYEIEVFDLHLAEGFANLSRESFAAVQYDGIHLTDLGAQYLCDAFVAYLNEVS